MIRLLVPRFGMRAAERVLAVAGPSRVTAPLVLLGGVLRWYGCFGTG